MYHYSLTQKTPFPNEKAENNLNTQNRLTVVFGLKPHSVYKNVFKPYIMLKKLLTKQLFVGELTVNTIKSLSLDNIEYNSNMYKIYKRLSISKNYIVIVRCGK